MVACLTRARYCAALFPAILKRYFRSLAHNLKSDGRDRDWDEDDCGWDEVDRGWSEPARDWRRVDCASNGGNRGSRRRDTESNRS